MNPDYTMDQRRNEPLPGAWRNKPISGGADYYGNNDSSRYQDPRYDYVGSYDNKADVDTMLGGSSSSYDRFNGNQPVFPPREDLQMLAGGDGPRKRTMRESGGSSIYPSKRPYESRSSAPATSNYRFQGDSMEILQEESRKCIVEMSQELAVMESNQVPEFKYLPHARRLLNDEVNKITENMNPDWLDVESSKSVKVLKRVLLPRTRPGSNVVGRLMGVGGSTLRKMCQTYKCHISICGTGSRKNVKEEQELLRTGESKYGHLACPLHAEVSTTGPPHLAYTRLGQILTLLHKIITIEERFEHDGLVFETSNTNKRRREDGDDYEDGNDQYEGEGKRTSNYRGRGRGRGRGSYNNRSGSPPQQRTNSWRNNGSEETAVEEVSERGSPQTNTSTRGSRGRGGFIPRGSGRGGFVPRARND